MFSKLLLVLGVLSAYGSNLMLKAPQKAYNQFYSYDSTNNDNFYYYNALFSDWSVNWVDNKSMILIATIETSYYAEMPDKVFDYFYFGLFGVEYDFTNVVVYYPGKSILINSPLDNSFPFVKSGNNVLYDKTLFPEYSFNYSITVNFGYAIHDPNARVYAEYAFVYEIAFTNELGIANYYADLQDVAYNDGYWDGYDDGADNGYDDGYIDGYWDGYDDGSDNGYDVGYSDGYDVGNSHGFNDGYINGIAEGITQAEGTWLGNLIFGTVGSVVGFIFAISDFEVLGVSIMSIITLFVAIGVIMLFIKLIKGTN